ncbi:hypothetical protein ACF0H5_018583 [Mactra antiquata]
MTVFRMSSFSKIFSFTAETLPVVTAFGVSCYALYQFALETVFLERECEKKAYNGHMKNPFDENTQKIIDEASSKFVDELSARQLASIKYYWCNKPSIQVNGSVQSIAGSYTCIGIPTHFSYKSPAEVDMSVIKDGFNINNIDPVLSEQLKHSLSLSENAKKFAITSAIHYSNSQHSKLKLDGVLLSLGGFGCGKLIADRFPGTLERSPAKLLALFVVILVVWTAIHYSIYDIYHKNLQVKCDRLTAESSEELYEGGLEYLEKCLQRNQILLKLVPSLQVFFDQDGNDLGSYITLSQRRELLIKNKNESDKTENLNNS